MEEERSVRFADDAPGELVIMVMCLTQSTLIDGEYEEGDEQSVSVHGLMPSRSFSNVLRRISVIGGQDTTLSQAVW